MLCNIRLVPNYPTKVIARTGRIGLGKTSRNNNVIWVIVADIADIVLSDSIRQRPLKCELAGDIIP